jgi:hypothetical protein
MSILIPDIYTLISAITKGTDIMLKKLYLIKKVALYYFLHRYIAMGYFKTEKI